MRDAATTSEVVRLIEFEYRIIVVTYFVGWRREYFCVQGRKQCSGMLQAESEVRRLVDEMTRGGTSVADWRVRRIDL